MLYFILRRVLSGFVTIFIVTLCVFFLIKVVPGSPFSSDRVMSVEAMKSLERVYGLDKPLLLQYADYLKNIIFHFDFGMSYKNIGTRINDILFKNGSSGFWLSIKFGFVVICVTVMFGVLLGILSAMNPNGLCDKIVSCGSLLGIAIPTIVTAPLLVLFFSVKFRLFPTGGWSFDLYHLILPVTSLSLPNIGILAQIQRTSLVDIMNSQFIKTARAKGLSKMRILLKHALKPAMMPVVSFLGPTSASILVGSVIIEKIFSLPGMGTLTIEAAICRNYSMILALVIIYSTLLIICNTIVDILYGFIDPRVKVK